MDPRYLRWLPILLVILVAMSTSASFVGRAASTQEIESVVGVPPNPGGTTYVDRDTVWSGTLHAGGDIVVGNSAAPVTFTLGDCTLAVDGSILIDSLSGGFKPVRFQVQRCTVTLTQSTSQILLDFSDPSRSGVNTGSTILVSNSTFQSPFTDPNLFPAGFVLRSGTSSYNVALVGIENTTFRNVGDYWGKNKAALHTMITPSLFSHFTQDSYVRRLTFVSPEEDMQGNEVAAIVGDSLPLEESDFTGGFMGTGFGFLIRNNTWRDTCRAIYDPISGALVEWNVVYGKYCKTIDFWHSGGTFRENILFDSIGPTPNGGGNNWQIIGNQFIRSRIVVNTAYGIVIGNNSFSTATSQSGEASIWDRGTRNMIIGNLISQVSAGGIYVQPDPSLPYTYEDSRVLGNTISGFASTYPGIKLYKVVGAIVAGNLVRNGSTAILLDTVSNASLDDNHAIGVAQGIEFRNSHNIIVRNSSFDTNGPSLVFDGGNDEIQFVSVRYKSVSFADPSDVLHYSDYVNVFVPVVGQAPVSITNVTGDRVFQGSAQNGSLRWLKLHLFDQRQSGATGFNPFTFSVGGLAPSQSYTVTTNGVPGQTVVANATGYVQFQQRVDEGTSVVIQQVPDQVAPAAVQDLRASSSGNGAWILRWTAPGDDGSSGTAYQYDVRYSETGPIDPSNWANAAVYPQAWVPLTAGSAEQHVLLSMSPKTDSWVAIRASDEAVNWGPVSNSVFLPGQTSGSAFTSLRVLSDRVEVKADGVAHFAAVAYDTNGNGIWVDPSWSAANGTIDPDGTWHPWSLGAWSVCAKFGNLSSCLISTVTPGKISQVAVKPESIDIEVGGTASLTVTAFDSRENVATGLSQTWTVEPADLGVLDQQNVFFGRQPGSGILRISVSDGVATKNATVSVNVRAGPFLGLDLSSVWPVLFAAIFFGATLVVTLAYLVRRFRKADKLNVEAPKKPEAGDRGPRRE